MSHEPIIGIDLGTTNCCAAVVRDGSPVVIPNRGHLTTPSVIAITATAKRLVGHQAKRQAVTNAEHTAFALKRLIGRSWDSEEVQQTVHAVPFELVEGPHQDVRVQLRGEQLSLAEASAMLLSELRGAAEEFLGENVSRAVVTVPAYFDDSQRQATRDAGEIAGLHVERIVNEPTAAALAYGFGRGVDKLVAVYDLGGGTFDISIVRVHGGDFEVIATSGDTALGGEDFDQRLIDWLIDGFQSEYGVDLRGDRIALQRLKDAAEVAKRTLSSADSADVNMPFLATKDGAPVHLERRLTRAEFEAMTDDLVQRTIGVCKAALSMAKVGARQLDEVVLVGGMSRMPAVQAAVRALFGKDPSKNVHPDEAVAVGAALHGASLAQQVDAVHLMDVTPHALGLLTSGGGFEVLVPANTRVPVERCQVFTTSRDGQTRLKLVVLQGTGHSATSRDRLGNFELADLPSLPRGAVSVEVSFRLDEDGILRAVARDVDSGQEKSIEITANSGLTRPEVEAMADSARRYEVQTKASELGDVSLAEVERSLDLVEAAMARAEAQSDDMDAFEAVGVTMGVVAEARAALRDGDLDSAGVLLVKLERALRDLKRFSA